jgi:ATP-dependent exoDNAse (exonuclease V) beta subunit
MSADLSPEQRRAVESTGENVCVVAGPGSGKTRVLTERFAWLVEHEQVSPARILAITFTEKGALEIKQRLLKRFAGEAARRDAIERAWVSTIHGFCARLLRDNAIAAGLAPDFTVLDAAPASRLERQSAEAALDALFAERPAEMRRLMNALDLSTQDDGRQPDLAASLIAVYEKMRVAGVSELAPADPPDSSAWEETRHAAREVLGAGAQSFLDLPPGPPSQAHFQLLEGLKQKLKNNRHSAAKRLRNDLLPAVESQRMAAWHADLHGLLRTAIRRIADAYRARKRRESALDFADLEEHTLRLLRTNTHVRTETIERFDHVLMDELQDTNPLQWQIVDIVRRRLFAVGDINQSIYGFRDADPEVFRRFHGNASVNELRDNYRSRPEILAAVSRALHAQPGIEPRDLIAKKPFAPAREPAVERLVGTGGDPEAAEAALVAWHIRHWRDTGAFRYGQIAVLFRTFASAPPLERAFHRLGIPFVLTGGRNFMEARECLDLLNLLAVLANPLDGIPLLGVLRSPLGGFSDDALARMSHDEWRQWFESRFGEVRKQAGYLAPDLLIARALDRSGYPATLAPHQRANVDQLLAWMRAEFRKRPRPLPEMLEDLEALRATQNFAPAPAADAGDVVQMMTIHAAKGLEFPAVFLCGLHRGTDRRIPPVLFSKDFGLGCQWLHPVTQEAIPDFIHAQIRKYEKAREDHEADRLLYVGMTRAMDRLVLSYAEKKRSSGWCKLAEAAAPEQARVEPPVLEAASVEVVETQAWTEVHLPVVSGQYDSAAAVTSIAMFAACPRRYYLARYLGLEPESTAPGTGAIELGLEVHRALSGERVGNAEAAALAERFMRSPLGVRTTRATRIEREFDFSLEIDDVILRGQIDLWFEENGELVLVDYKTDREASSGESYALQLRLYALALERYAGRLPDRALLHYLRLDQTVEISLAFTDLAAARAMVTQFRQAQDDLVFPLRAGEQCGKCSFRGGLCPEGRVKLEDALSSGRTSWRPSSFPAPATDAP